MATENTIMPTGATTSTTPSSDRISSISSTSIDKNNQPHNAHNAPTQAIEADALDELNLPYRTLTSEANMRAYTTETPSGNILREVQSNKTG